MKYPLILCFLFLPMVAVGQAKEPMIGIRQGVSLWLLRTGIGQGTLKYAAGQHFTWDKEVFYRAQLKDKWWYDVSLSYYSFKNAGENRRKQSYTERNDIIGGTVSLQYDVTYPLLGFMFYSMQGMRAFVGFELSPALSFNQEAMWDATNVSSNARSTTFSMMLGFTYTHVVPVSRRLSVISRLGFHTNSFSKYQSFSGELKPNKRVGLVTGIGYKL